MIDIQNNIKIIDFEFASDKKVINNQNGT